MTDALVIPGKPRPWIMAHRGASDLAPENSMAAFRLALEHGADLIETDLWLSADHELICHHDRTFQRMCGEPRAVTELRLPEIRRLQLGGHGGGGGERVPTLEELFEIVPLEVPIMLELKDPGFGRSDMAQHLARAIRHRAEHRAVGIIGFRLDLLLAVKRHVPGVVLGHISRWNPFPTQPTELLGPFWPLLRLNPHYVAMAHRLGRRVCPLDPKLHDRLGRWLELDVDAVLTNDPRATRQRIEALRVLGR